MTDTQGTFQKYSKLMRDLKFTLFTSRENYSAITEAKYQPFEENKKIVEEATDFFDSNSSSIELVMENGEIVTRHFEILPPFMTFQQVEKDYFWLNANLDNSKTVIESFMKFSNDKINELFIQHDIQNSWYCLKDAAKKSSWLTDIGIFLILLINFILLFGLQVHEGDKLKNPKLFSTSSLFTKTILYIFGSLKLLFFIYMTIIQGLIVVKLQDKRATKEQKQISKKGKCKNFIRVLWYMLKNKEETLQARSIWCLIFCLIFSFAGLAINFYWS